MCSAHTLVHCHDHYAQNFVCSPRLGNEKSENLKSQNKPAIQCTCKYGKPREIKGTVCCTCVQIQKLISQNFGWFYFGNQVLKLSKGTPEIYQAISSVCISRILMPWSEG